jgi:hypothetical protein
MTTAQLIVRALTSTDTTAPAAVAVIRRAVAAALADCVHGYILASCTRCRATR